jgi:hypothetical protein
MLLLEASGAVDLVGGRAGAQNTGSGRVPAQLPWCELVLLSGLRQETGPGVEHPRGVSVTSAATATTATTTSAGAPTTVSVDEETRPVR